MSETIANKYTHAFNTKYIGITSLAGLSVGSASAIASSQALVREAAMNFDVVTAATAAFAIPAVLFGQMIGKRLFAFSYALAFAASFTAILYYNPMQLADPEALMGAVTDIFDRIGHTVEKNGAMRVFTTSAHNLTF